MHDLAYSCRGSLESVAVYLGSEAWRIVTYGVVKKQLLYATARGPELVRVLRRFCVHRWAGVRRRRLRTRKALPAGHGGRVCRHAGHRLWVDGAEAAGVYALPRRAGLPR